MTDNHQSALDAAMIAAGFDPRNAVAREAMDTAIKTYLSECGAILCEVSPARHQRRPVADVNRDQWVEVFEEDIAHYTRVGQEIRSLHVPLVHAEVQAMVPTLRDCAAAWVKARSNMVNMPMNSPDWRARLNALSEAEDTLARTVTGIAEAKNG